MAEYVCYLYAINSNYVKVIYFCYRLFTLKSLCYLSCSRSFLSFFFVFYLLLICPILLLISFSFSFKWNVKKSLGFDVIVDELIECIYFDWCLTYFLWFYLVSWIIQFRFSSLLSPVSYTVGTLNDQLTVLFEYYFVSFLFWILFLTPSAHSMTR